MKCMVLGCGHMHAYSYVDSLKELGCEIIGLTDRNEEQGAAFCERKQLTFFREEELLNQQADFALICSENILHKEYAIMAAEMGLHVIVEKPLATTLEDAREMIAVCKNNNVLLMVCFPVRYCEPVKRAKKIIDEGMIGDIVSITATNHGSMPGGWFVDPSLSGGGAVIDHTVHVADIVNMLMNSPVKEVYALMDTLIHPLTVEDSGLLLMEFENGVIMSLDTSWNRPACFPVWGDVVLDINGTKGSIHVDAFADAVDVYSNHNKFTRRGFGADSDMEMLKGFLDAIQNGSGAPVSGEDGLYALEIALKAYESQKRKP